MPANVGPMNLAPHRRCFTQSYLKVIVLIAGLMGAYLALLPLTV